MKTVKKIICSNCKVPLTENNFYWHSRENKTIKSTMCKQCISDKDKKKREEQKLEQHFYF